MIIGVFLRSFKTYAGINYIPLTNGHSFCGLVGNNGIGKSSVLESLDCLLNNKVWNYNVGVKKSGISTAEPYIVPVYLLPLDKVSAVNVEIAKKISNHVWNAEASDIAPKNRAHFKTFLEQRILLKEIHDTESSLLIPLGLSYEKIINFSIFDQNKIFSISNYAIDDTTNNDHSEELKAADLLHEEIRELFEYIYIPKDIDPEKFTQLETKEIQSLMGETLNEIVEKCVPSENIK